MRTVVSIEGALSKPAPDASVEILNYLDGLYRFALRLTRNADDAQELVQETVLRAWQRKQTITRNPRAWLYRTLYHTFVSNRRHYARRVTELSQDDAIVPGPMNSVPAAIQTVDVRSALESLTEDLRIVVWLSDAEGLHLREIAQALDWHLGTVASRLWRARQELRIALSDYGRAVEEEP